MVSPFSYIDHRTAYHQQKQNQGPTFRSSHFNRLALHVMHPVLLFLCLGLVLGGFRIAPGVG